MAWKGGDNGNWKWQLRDRKGRWIEMGRGVKWYSPSLGREVSGTVVGQKGKDAIVDLTSEPKDAKTGLPRQVSVKGSDIEVIASKATLGAPKSDPAVPAGPKASVPDNDADSDSDSDSDSDASAPKTVNTPARTAAPTSADQIAKDLAFLEQDAEDNAGLSGDELDKAIEESEYPFTNDAGEEMIMSLVADENDDLLIGVSDKDGDLKGSWFVPETIGDRMDKAKDIKAVANGEKQTIDADEDEDAESDSKATLDDAAPETAETPEEAPEAPSEAKELEFYVESGYARDQMVAEGNGMEAKGRNDVRVTDPDLAVKALRRLVRESEESGQSGSKSGKTAKFATTRAMRAALDKVNREYPESAKQAPEQEQEQVADLDAPAPSAPSAPESPATDAPKAPEASSPAPAVSQDPLEAAGVTRTEPVKLDDEKFPPTRQQQDVIDAVLAGKDTAVQAKAGTGKTSTLEALAKRIALQDPNKKIAYIAFNKTVQTEAEGRMPGNVEARTGHSIAYQWSPDWMKKRSNDNDALRRGDDVAAHLGIRETLRPEGGGEPLGAKDQAIAAVKTVDKFANSAQDTIDASHLPDDLVGAPENVQKAIIDSANKVWNDLKSENGKMRFSLDHMRKMWAQTSPDLSKAGTGLRRGADIIFMDESQDTPPVLARVMDEQTAQKVVVGDSDQNIYSSFTGSIDYMAQTKKDVELPLTKSWRFGPAVADIGNRFLQMSGSNGRVEGGGESAIVDGMQDPDAILVRSNTGMIDAALGEIEKGRTVGVPKGTKADLNSLVNSAGFLMGKGTKPPKMHDDLAQYKSWDEVIADAEKGDATAKRISGLVQQNGLGGLRAVIDAIVEGGGDGLVGVSFEKLPSGTVAGGKTFGTPSAFLKQAGFKWREIPGAPPMKSGKNKGMPRKGWMALGSDQEQKDMVQRAKDLSGGEATDVVVSTAHKSKGLEWDKVKIGDDFRGPKLNEETGEMDMPSPEELRLAYVAVTRAAKELDPGSLNYVFDHSDENGGIPDAPVPASDTSNDVNNDPEEDRGVSIPTEPDDESTPLDDDGVEYEDPDAAGNEVMNEEYRRIEEEAEAERRAAEEAPADSAPEDAPNTEDVQDTAPPEEGASEDDNGVPVADETDVPEEEALPEVEPEDMPSGDAPEPQELPREEAPSGGSAPAGDESAPADSQPAEEDEAPSPAPAPEEAPTPEQAPEPAPRPDAPATDEAPAPEPEEAPRGGTELPTPDSRPLHPVKQKAANYPDGTIIRNAKTGQSIEKTNGAWHEQGDPSKSADPMDMENPFVFDMPKQEDSSFEPFDGIDFAAPGDIITTRNGSQAAVVGKRDGKLVVAPHNMSEEQRRMRPALAQLDPSVVKGINRFGGAPSPVPNAPTPERQSEGGGTSSDAPAPSGGGTAPSGEKRSPFSGNRGNPNVTIKDSNGNEIKRGDTVLTPQGPGKILSVRPSDGPGGSAMVELENGTKKSFRSNKMRNAEFTEQTGGDDPKAMNIGDVGHTADGREFVVGAKNTPLFKGGRVRFKDGREGKATGVYGSLGQANVTFDDGTKSRKSVGTLEGLDEYTPTSGQTDGNAPESTPESEPAPTPESAPEAPAEDTQTAPEPEPEELPEPTVSSETPEERDARRAGVIQGAVNGESMQRLYKALDDNGVTENDIIELGETDPDTISAVDDILSGNATTDRMMRAARGLAFSSIKRRGSQMDSPLKKVEDALTDFVAETHIFNEKKRAAEEAKRTQAPVYREPDSGGMNGNQSMKTDRALAPKSLTKAEAESYSGVGRDEFANFDLENSKFNVLSKEGESVAGGTAINKHGEKIKAGSKLYNRNTGEFIGFASIVTSRNAHVLDPYRPSQRTREMPVPIDNVTTKTDKKWDTSTDLEFTKETPISKINSDMSKAYPGVVFEFGGLDTWAAADYATTISKLFNKYPHLQKNVARVDSEKFERGLTGALAVARTAGVPGLRNTNISVNQSIMDQFVGKETYFRLNIQHNAKKGHFNDIPPGREFEYLITHEIGHALDFMTGNLNKAETYEMMSEITGDPKLAKTLAPLGKWLLDNKQLSQYSTVNGKVYTIELLAESFVDVELNGINAKPLSKMIHAEMMNRLRGE